MNLASIIEGFLRGIAGVFKLIFGTNRPQRTSVSDRPEHPAVARTDSELLAELQRGHARPQDRDPVRDRTDGPTS